MPPPGRGFSGFRLAAGVVIGLFFAGLTVRDHLAAIALDRQDPATALRLVPGSSEALSAIAADRLDAHDPRGAAAAATAAIVQAPLSPAALRTLALAAFAAGNNQRGAALMGQGAALGWRDGPTQLWLAGAARAAGDVDASAGHMDAVARMFWLTASLYPSIDGFITDPRLRAALARRLATTPAWRSAYLLDKTPVSDEQLQLRAALLRDLATTPAPPTPEELRAAINRLIEAGLFGDARALWAVAGPAGRDHVPFDGDFAAVPDDISQAQSFDWRLSALGGSTTAVPEGGNGAPTLLHVTALGGGPGGALARQILLLRPGAYRLSYVARVTDARAALGLRWSVVCMPALGLVSWAPATRSTRLAKDILPFVVPADGSCGAQRLELHLDNGSTVPFEAWYGGMAIQ